MNQIPPEAGRLHIRSLTPEDYPLYDQWEADLHRMHVEARPDLFCPLEHPVPQEQYLEELNDCHELRLLPEADGAPAGMCSFTLREAPGSPLRKPDKSLYVVAVSYTHLDVYKRQAGARLLRRLAEDRYAVLYVTEALCTQIPEEIGRLRERPLPAVVPIPGISGNTGMGLEQVKRSVEQAVGSNILENES